MSRQSPFVIGLSGADRKELAAELVTQAVVAAISASTVWRILDRDAIRPWLHRMWIFPRDPDFAAKAARALDLYPRIFNAYLPELRHLGEHRVLRS